MDQSSHTNVLGNIEDTLFSFVPNLPYNKVCNLQRPTLLGIHFDMG